VTIGKAGSLAYIKDVDKTVRIIPPSITKLSTIGSGDSFTAGMVYSFIKEFDFIESLKMSTAIAAANTLMIGAGLFNKKDIQKLYKKVKVI
jgi:fructose-1-phosphate kinase PfkB-like protein